MTDAERIARLENAPPAKITAPDLEGWEAYCDQCGTFRTFTKRDERDAETFEAYCEYVCDECYSILMTLQRINSGERE